tara:strand:- start:207 stop:401 length:195 start_codon:yes stop_codon:yes gene_type:complete
MSTTISEDEYLEAVDGMAGFCIKCKDFTKDCVEPDAAKYECPACEQKTVYGTEDCLIMGFITIC